MGGELRSSWLNPRVQFDFTERNETVEQKSVPGGMALNLAEGVVVTYFEFFFNALPCFRLKGWCQ